jgi:hypothetical protein
MLTAALTTTILALVFIDRREDLSILAGYKGLSLQKLKLLEGGVVLRIRSITTIYPI